jgi:hypothetical protein
MLSFDDKRWAELSGGYRMRFDPRPFLSRIEFNDRVAEAWNTLWEELHHQGDVGDASYAAVPHIVRIHRQRGTADWNPYALVAVIELAREKGKNPALPEWLKDDYCEAIQDLAKIGSVEVLRAKNAEELRAILSVLALAKGARTYARVLLENSEEELIDMQERAFESHS